MKIGVRRIAIICAVALILTGMAAAGWLFTIDGIVSDAFYQRVRATDGQIVVVGMDQQALDKIGPLPWSRSIMAEAIRYLNQDENNKPAVIGLDVLYAGESGDPSADEDLVSAAMEGENVVTAAAATFSSELVDDGEDFYIDDRSVAAWDSAFGDLRDVTEMGHINAMTDRDGVIRHALLYVDNGEENVLSFSRVIYEKYCRTIGEEVKPLPDTLDGFFYIPFHTKGGGYYDSISVADLLEGNIDPSFFAGKVVLIGPYAAGLQDEYRTSVDHASPTYGVEIQANLIDAFRDGDFATEVSDRLQLLLLFLITAGVLFFFWDRHIAQSVIMWAGVSLVWLVLCFTLYNSGLILHVLWIPLCTSLCFVGSIADNYLRSQIEKRRITNTFGKYVDPVVMKQLLEKRESLQLGGEMYNIAVLFVDIRGFTTMSESLEPPVIVDIINQYLTLTTKCIMEHHGTLDKFVGDCTMAFWNAPLAQEDPVYLAALAAMDMVEGSRELGEKLQERFGRTVSFGIGINYGPAVVGNIGAPIRMDYTAIGDTVNTSARLEANAPGGKIFISRAVADELGDRAKVTSLGETIHLKGKTEGFEVLTLDELKR